MFDKNQLSGMMKKAQEMQVNLQKTQAEIANLEIDGVSGAGLVKIIMTGKHDIKKIDIDDSLMSDKEMLADLIAAAINDANRKLEEKTSDKMGALGAGGFPGMGALAGLKLPF